MSESDDRTGGERLADELEARDLGVRTLARQIASDDGVSIEVARRMIYRALNDQTSDDKLRRIAVALGLPNDSFVDSLAVRSRARLRLAELAARVARLETERESLGPDAAELLGQVPAILKRLDALEAQRRQAESAPARSARGRRQ